MQMLQQGIRDRELREAYPAATIAYADYFAAYVRDAPEMGSTRRPWLVYGAIELASTLLR